MGQGEVVWCRVISVRTYVTMIKGASERQKKTTARTLPA